MILDEDVVVGRTDLLGTSEAGLELRLRSRPWTAFAGLGGGGTALVAVGIVAESWAILIPIGAVGLLICAFALVPYLRRRHVALRIVLTPTGVTFEQPYASVGVRWPDVSRVALLNVSNVPHLGIEAPGEKVVQRDGPRRVMAMNRSLSGAAIAVPANALRADPEDLLDEIAAYARDPSPLSDPERERAALAARLAA